MCHSEKRNNFFTLPAVKTWNELPEDVVQAPSVNTFKNRLDTFWSKSNLLYSYRTVKMCVLWKPRGFSCVCVWVCVCVCARVHAI